MTTDLQAALERIEKLEQRMIENLADIERRLGETNRYACREITVLNEDTAALSEKLEHNCQCFDRRLAALEAIKPVRFDADADGGRDFVRWFRGDSDDERRAAHKRDQDAANFRRANEEVSKIPAEQIAAAYCGPRPEWGMTAQEFAACMEEAEIIKKLRALGWTPPAEKPSDVPATRLSQIEQRLQELGYERGLLVAERERIRGQVKP